MAGPLGKSATIGRLRHRVKVQRRKTGDEAARDEFLQEVPDWVDVATVWAEVEAVGGRELMKSEQVQANASHRVRLRYRAGLTPANRLVWLFEGGNAVLNVVSCPPSVGKDNVIEVTCLHEA